jgi:carbon monoxide dehydrogenase subunit G
MQFSGSLGINASRAKVWAFVTDPNQVGSCGPGVESIEVIDPTHFRARAKVGVGFITSRFTVDLRMAEQAEPDRAVIAASGQAPGSAVDGTGEMRLSGPPEGPTTLDWSATVHISGTLASVGARLIEGTANKLIGQSFDCIRAKLEG